MPSASVFVHQRNSLSAVVKPLETVQDSTSGNKIAQDSTSTLQSDKPSNILDTSENSKQSTSPYQNLTKTTPCIEAKAGWQLVCQDDTRCKKFSLGCKNALINCQTCQVGCSPCEELGCPFRYSCTGINRAQKPIQLPHRSCMSSLFWASPHFPPSHLLPLQSYSISFKEKGMAL